MSDVKLEIVRSIGVSFQTEFGKHYQILTSTDIDSDVWGEFGDPIEGTGEVYTFHQNTEDPGNTFFQVIQTESDLEEITISDLEMVMIPIPAGTFVMGSPDDEEGRFFSEEPQTTVTISRPFWMSKFEVTQGQYEELMGTNPSWFKNVGTKAPVEQVTWDDAVEFCQRLTKHERSTGNLSVDFKYQLPTEAQWEYACRAGMATRFSYGNDPGSSDLENYAWYQDNSGNTTHPVGEKLANPWGLHDMHGNVSEWCLDWYRNFLDGENLIDPAGPTLGALRVNRSGNWGDLADLCRSASRSGFVPSGTRRILGFRPILVSIPKEPEPPELLGFPLEMKLIPAGTFVMGSPDDEEDRDNDEDPLTTVTISQPFWMSKYEVTISQVRNYLLDGGTKDGIGFTKLNCPISNDSTFSLRNNKFSQNGNQPMVEITWEGAVSFCEWLTEQERATGRLPEGHEYRLPTEAQWEYACRAGTTTRFSYGDDPSDRELSNYAWYRDNSGKTTHPVGEKLPNPWGLHDMHGNVYEWCSDWYRNPYSGGNLTDPRGPTLTGQRVSRGGIWSRPAGFCRSAFRFASPPNSSSTGFGFRPVLVPIP